MQAMQAELKGIERTLQRSGRGARYIANRMAQAAAAIRERQKARSIQRCDYMPAPRRDPKTGENVPRLNPGRCGGRLRRSGGLLVCKVCGRVGSTQAA